MFFPVREIFCVLLTLGSDISTLLLFFLDAVAVTLVSIGVVMRGVSAFISPPRAWKTGIHSPKSLESISFLSIAVRAMMTRAFRGREGAMPDDAWLAMAVYTTVSSALTVARLNRERE